MNILLIIIIAVFVLLSIVGFASMGIDKSKAKDGKWRVPEKVLFGIALVGGVGSTIGMYVFRHKTKHWYFVVFFPLFALIDLAALGAAVYFLAIA